MKKISIMFASLALAVGFSACDETKDDNPVLTTHEGQPVLNFLNAPTLQNTYIDLTEDAASNTLHMTCSQPKEYGIATTVNYYVQVAFDDKFTNYSELSNGFTNCAQINPTNGSMAEGLCNVLQTDLRNQKGNPEYELTQQDVLDFYNGGYKPLYVRLRSQVVGIPDLPVEGTEYISNVVQYKNVACNYMALTPPDKPSGIYLRGTMNDWGNSEGTLPPYEFYTTKVKGTYITHVVSMPANTNFKVADANWGPINLGGASIEIDSKNPIALKDNGGDMALSSEFEGVVLLTNSGSWKIQLVSASKIKDIKNINGMLGPVLKEEFAPYL